MEDDKKLAILRGLDTKKLVNQIHEAEAAFEKIMIAEADFKAQSHDYLGLGDCQEVKRILAELSMEAPETNDIGKKLTVPDKEKWLLRQRKENKELNDAISKQKQVTFLVEDYRIKVEMAKRRLESLKAILALKTAQINFLAS